MSDRLTDDEIEELRRLRAKGVEKIEKGLEREEPEIAMEGNHILSRVAWEELPRILDELDRQRNALSRIREITDPDTDTMEAPMEAIRGVLEEV